jgi:uncharacterized protein (DUF302 family)
METATILIFFNPSFAAVAMEIKKRGDLKKN